jgi:very-short-patch-repair endonuclease
MGHKGDTPDRRVAEIASRQHGVITLRQLEAAGVTREAVYKRARRGRLHRLHRGVYAVGHSAPSWHRRWLAAVRACGDGAVLSHLSAASLWELLRPIDGPVHVSVPTTAGLKKRRGIHLHRSPSLMPEDSPPSLAGPPSSPPSPAIRGGRGRGTSTTRRHNIPITTIQRTIDDLKGTVPPHLLRRAKRQAEHKGIHLDGAEGNRLRSDLEEDFLSLFRRHRLTPVETNVKIGRHEVDFLWRFRDLVVEVDSFRYHRGSVSFQEDHARDLELRSRGYTVLRYTEEQLDSEPERIAADVAAALAV